ncbi:M66 family metalloprotease [Rhizobacter sp. Root1221]|uniref:M66 family metalloprotease n=1 Tax=Rhizobacter sp. Root1221 TaxID=1736433 RepID=UPI0012FB406D|nr:M66 family metalloprotease [Rhizobacter sp. Root1221]
MKELASKALVVTLTCSAATLSRYLRRLTVLSALVALAACGGADKATPVQADSATRNTTADGAPPAAAVPQAVAAAMVVNGPQIAMENRSFSFSGTKSVMYGADGKYLVANVTSQGTCSNAFFGSDPAPGIAKACYADLGWPQIATENLPLNFSGGKTVMYGADGKYYLATLTSPGACSNAFFGGDPAPGAIKACHADLGWPRIATEGQSLSYSGSKTVLYGANSKYVLGTLTNQGTCSSAFFGSDPVPGVVKACYADVSGTQVATENNPFSVSGTRTVMYGANGKFVLATVTNQGTCSSAFFGADPAPGTVKACHVVEDGATSTPAPGSPSTARIARIDVAQSHVFPSTDSALVLVSGKSALVRVNATTTNTNETQPTATLQVETSTGQLVQSIAMSVPANALPTAVPDAPSSTNAYTAVIPAALVTQGLRLTAKLSNGQTSTINPRVGGGAAVTLLVMPVQIGSTVGQIANGAGSYVQARMPAASVTVQTRATYVSKTATAMPTDESAWNQIFSNVLAELYDLHMLEGASSRTFYYGFIPKRSYGLAGLGYMPGPASVGFDMPSNLGVVRQTLAHELGHNFSLPHAPCGNAGNPDPQYPYANGQLGAAGRYIWGYDASTGAYIDARRTDLHDMMSYCGGDSFSDYNYRRMQIYLTPADKMVIAASASAEATGPQELLLVSGKINGDKIELTPLKSLRGEPRLPEGGIYTLRIISAQGTVDYPFSPRQLDHAQAEQHFGFTIPHPGAIYGISVLKDGKALLQNAVKPANGVSAAREKVAASVKPQVQVTEQGGVLRLTWDAASYKYLTVTHVGETRTTLAQDLQGGTATLSGANLPAGGSFEFSLSDGLNAVRIETAR